MNVAELKKMTVAQLQKHAEKLRLNSVSGLKKQ